MVVVRRQNAKIKVEVVAVAVEPSHAETILALHLKAVATLLAAYVVLSVQRYIVHELHLWNKSWLNIARHSLLKTEKNT